MSRRTGSISATKGLLAFVGSGQRRAVAGDPTNIVDVGDRPDLAYNLLDVGQTRRLEREPAQGRAVFDGVYPRREDVYPSVRDGRGDVFEEVHTIQCLDKDLDRKKRPSPLHPLDLDEAIRVARLQSPSVRAPRRVHHDAASQRDVPHNVIAGHWAATAGQTRQNPARTHDPYPRLRVGPTLGVWQGQGRKCRGTRSVRLLFLLGLDLLDHAVGDVFGGEGAQTHGGEHVVRGRTVGALGDLLPNRGINLLDALLLEERHNLLASPTALAPGEPVPARLGRLSGDDLPPVAGDELGV